MRLILLSLLLSGCAQAEVKPQETVCKDVSYKSDCNTCTYQMCTNGIEQWQTIGFCTLEACVQSHPYKAEDWE